MWTAQYLARRPETRTVFTVKAVRLGLRWHEIRGLVDGSERTLFVNGDPKVLAEALRAAGFTAGKTKKGSI